MKKLFLLITILLASIKIYACHGTSLALVSGPTAIGGGQYSTVIKPCFAQYTAGNWGGTNNFNITVVGATFASFSPATITNTYYAYTTASCSGPNCFMGGCALISATATGSLISSTVIQYSTTTSTPAGYPLVPDDNESCAGTSTSYCPSITVVTNGYPTSMSLNGNVEVTRPRVCTVVCGHGTTYSGGPCNGSYDAQMTITFSPLPIELISFTGDNYGDFNILKWLTATETNNDYFTLEKSYDGVAFDIVAKVDGSGNSLQIKRYSFTDNKLLNDITYYRLKQTDFNGESKTSSLIAVTRNITDTEFKVIKITNVLGQEITDDVDGIKIYYFSNGTVLKRYDMKER